MDTISTSHSNTVGLGFFGNAQICHRPLDEYLMQCTPGHDDSRPDYYRVVPRTWWSWAGGEFVTRIRL